jgi:predicted nucleic acid-binding protein
MVLVDTSIWIDHLNKPTATLAMLLANRDVLIHPLVIGEIAMGSLKGRTQFLRYLQKLPKAQAARDAEVLSFIEAEALYSLGIGYIDAHLLAASRLVPGTRLWTRDKRLDAVAEALGLKYAPIPRP